MASSNIDIQKVRKALSNVATAGEPGELDPAVGPHGGTHDTDIEIADDVVKLVDTNSPDTADLETRAYKPGTEEDGSEDSPPYDGDASVDGIPTIPDTLAAAQDDAGDDQKGSGGGGPVVQLPDTMTQDLSVDPMDPHASASITTGDIDDLRRVFSKEAEPNVAKAVTALQWLDRNEAHPKRDTVQAGLDNWSPTRAQAAEAQARYGFAYLHTDASAAPDNQAQTASVLAWLKSFLTGRKVKIAADFLNSDRAKENPELTKQIESWHKTHAVDQVNENREDVGLDDITLYGDGVAGPDNTPSSMEDNKVVSLDDVPFKDPARHPAEAGAETDEQTASPADDANAVDSDSFSAKGDDRAKESNLPTAKTRTQANPLMQDPLMMQDPAQGCGGEEVAPPVPGMPPMPVEAPPAAPAAPPVAPPMPPMDPMADPLAQEPMPPMPGMEPEGIPPVLPEDEAPAMEMPGGAPMGAEEAPVAPGGGMEQSLEEWLMQEMMEEQHQPPAESMSVEMLQSYDEIGAVVAADIVMALHGPDQENPHWNIDIKGQPIARVELKDQPKPEEVRSTFLSGPYAENISQAMEKVGVSEVLQAINAKPYAAKIEVGALAQKIEAKVKADMEAKFAEKVGELRDRFLTAAKIALAGYNANFFRGEDHALKAALWSELQRLGVRDASQAVEAGFVEGSVPFFEAVLTKAEKLMDMPDEARNAIAKAIPETNSLVTAGAADGDELPAYETLARKLESGNIPFESVSSPVTASRSDLARDLRAKVKLSEYRSS